MRTSTCDTQIRVGKLTGLITLTPKAINISQSPILIKLRGSLRYKKQNGGISFLKPNQSQLWATLPDLPPTSYQNICAGLNVMTHSNDTEDGENAKEKNKSKVVQPLTAAFDTLRDAPRKFTAPVAFPGHPKY